MRDLLMGGENHKIELLVDGSAVEFARSLKGIIPGKLCYYERFGTATLKLSGDIIFDMVTVKKDLYTFPGSLSLVGLQSLKNDLYRQDFTINTLACTLNPDSFGLLHDYFGGEDDLREGVIRVLYKLSFVDKPLRIFRALCFEQRFNFIIETETFSLLRAAITRRLLEKVSKEKLYREVKQIFREPYPSRVLERMYELGIFRIIFPRVHFDLQLKNRVKQLEFFFRKWEVKGWGKKPDLEIFYLGLLFYGLPEHDIKYLCDMMRLRKKARLTILTTLNKLPVFLRELRLGSSRPSETCIPLEGMPPEGLVLALALEKDRGIQKRILRFWEYQCGRKPFFNEKGGV